MINSSKESINKVVENIDKSIDYFINQHIVDLTGANRIRNDANIVRGLVEYRSALNSLLEEITPKKKRGNPNFGKNNPYNKAASALDEPDGLEMFEDIQGSRDEKEVNING